MDASTQFRLEMIEDAIKANQAPEDATYLAKLMAMKDQILAGYGGISKPSLNVGEIERPADSLRSGGTGSSRPERKASPGMMSFIERLLAERQVPSGTLHDGALALYRVACQSGNPMGFRAAMDLGDWLKTLPYTGTGTARRPASDGQLRMVNARRSEKGMRALAQGELFMDEVDEELAQIDALPSIGKRIQDAAELESGMYRKGDVIYKVYRAVHGSGKMVAKELVKLATPVTKRNKQHEYEFSYRGLATRFVSAGDRMTLEQAKEFGAIYGVCCCCGATLTDEKSIAEGIGPICKSRV